MVTMNAIDKTLRLGTRKTYGGRAYSVYCKVRYDGTRLSITGVEGPLASGNCLGGCGQIDMHWTPLHTYAPGWDSRKVRKFLDTWRQWHLNDMRAECEHQRALGWTYATHKDTVTKFGRGCCPRCGYKIGSAWRVEAVPAETVAFLADLPDADRTPAWV